MPSVSDLTRAELERFRNELFEFLSIPSVSARSEFRDDTRKAASWVVDTLSASGLEAQLFETPGHPIALGEWRGAGPKAPTLLVYGHYDVQPPEPLERWTSPPFEPTIRNGRVYARGAADNKGQLFLHLKALELLLARHGELPVNVVLLAEGEEEVGSTNLRPFLETHTDRLRADAVVISDSAMFGPGLPSLLFSLRGLSYFEIRARTARTDLHSGMYGGAAPNAATALARLLASLHDAEGRVAIRGFYDGVVEWDEETLRGIRELPFREGTLLEETGAHGLVGEKGYSVLERLWLRPSADVNGILSGYVEEGAKTVIPAEAMAKVSFRLVPDQDPDEIARLVSEHVERIAPPEVEVEVRELHRGRPWRARPDGPYFEAARAALRSAFGRDPVLVGEGASIPVVADFERHLGAQVLLVGFALPGANMHAPDEWFPLDHIEKGILTLLNFYSAL